MIDLHKNPSRFSFGAQNLEEDFPPPNQLKLPSKRSIYANSMVPSQTKTNEIYSQKTPTQDSNSRSMYNSRTGPANEEDSEYYHESVADRCPRTPSPSAHNKKIRLDSMNSFSEQGRKNQKSHTGKDVGSEEYDESYDSPMQNDNMTQGERDELDEFCASKMKKKVCCNCKKSRCLKLYCDCFGRGIPCAKECNCLNCLNTEAHVREREEAMRSIKERNPSAFKPKIDRTESPEKVNFPF